ncbi:MAG: sulfotransferase family protein [Acidimicrobiales bacterium]
METAMSRSGTDARPEPAGPLFLVGAPRSGTTLLYKALCLHADAAWISNWVGHFPRLVVLARLNRLASRFPKWRRAAWFGTDANAYVFGSKRTAAARMFPMPVEGGPLFARFGFNNRSSTASESAPSGGVQIEALQEAFEAIRYHSGAPVLISKRIINNRQIAELAQAFPSARFVELVRDGRAVAYSLSRVDWWEDSVVWWCGSTPRQWRERGGDPWELAARHWPEELAVIHRGLAAVAPARVMQVRYESLVAAPRSTLDQIAGFAGLRYSEAWKSEVARLAFRDRNEEWQSHLDAAVVRRIEALQHERLRQFGYVG